MGLPTDIHEDKRVRRRTEPQIVTLGDGGVQAIEDLAEAVRFAALTLLTAGRGRRVMRRITQSFAP